MLIFSRFCVHVYHGDQVSQAKNSKFLAVMTQCLDESLCEVRLAKSFSSRSASWS